MLYVYKRLVNEQLKKSWKIYLLFTVSCNERYYQFEQNQNSKTRMEGVYIYIYIYIYTSMFSALNVEDPARVCKYTPTPYVHT